jgi:hypothetical protein
MIKYSFEKYEKTMPRRKGRKIDHRSKNGIERRDKEEGEERIHKEEKKK